MGQHIAQAPAGVPNLYALEKRCCSYAEAGRYREALEDAEYILEFTEDPARRGAALMRVKAIKDFMKRMKNFDSGYHQATATLVCLLRPREHRQLVQSNPATYSRPQTAGQIGRGLTTYASMAKLLHWDKDGDGQIDMEEFKQGAAALGYHVKDKGKNAFGEGREVRGYT